MYYQNATQSSVENQGRHTATVLATLVLNFFKLIILHYSLLRTLLYFNSQTINTKTQVVSEQFEA